VAVRQPSYNRITKVIKRTADIYIRFSLRDFAIEPRSRLPSKIVARRTTPRTQIHSSNNLSTRTFVNFSNMPSENTNNATADLKQESSVARLDLRDDSNLATPKDPTAPQKLQITQESQAAKESYDNYIKNLPPPFWETKSRQTKAANDEAIAAKINAICPPVTAEQREEDERLKAMSWRERWRDRKARREAKEKNKDPDLRPVERGSRAQANVFGVNTREKQRKQ
jgi:hypothetical protein